MLGAEEGPRTSESDAEAREEAKRHLETTRTSNIIWSMVFILVGIIVFTQMGALDETATGSDPGAAGYPRLLAGIMLALAVGLGFQRGTGEAMPTRRDGLRVLAAVGLLVLYYLTINALGYILSTSIFVLGMMLVMGIRKVWLLILMPLAFSILVFVVFYTLFGVPLPRVFLEGFFS